MARPDKEAPFLRRPQVVPRKRRRPAGASARASRRSRARRRVRTLAVRGELALRALALRSLGQHARPHRGDSRRARPVERPEPPLARPPASRVAARRASLDRARHAREEIPGRSRGARDRAPRRRPLPRRREFLVGRSGRPPDRRLRSAAGPHRVRHPERRAPRIPEAVGLLDDLRAARPEYFSALSEIASLPDGGFGMMDAIFRRPVRVLRVDAPEKVRALLEARSFIESRGWEARAIDLRFADRVILVGAYGAGNRL